jgi:hypothetical protein
MATSGLSLLTFNIGNPLSSSPSRKLWDASR